MSRLPRLRLLGVGAVALAVLLSIVGVPVTSAQGTTLFPVRVDRALPVDAPFDAAWDAVAPVDVPLSGQAVVPPMAPQPAFPSIRVRSLVNGDTMAMLLEWADPTRDESTLTVGSFADAVAVQFALGMSTSICMGQRAGGLNIWHWKADWAADIANGRQDVQNAHPNMPLDVDFPVGATGDADGFVTGRMVGNPRSAAVRPSSVENLNAVGFGSLTPQPPAGQTVHGASDYRDGTWRVVMSRRLSDDNPNDALLQPGGPSTVVAFAVWDGSRGDRNGQKSVSTWLSLTIPPGGAGPLDALPFAALVGAALLLAVVVVYLGARRRRRPSASGSGPGAGSGSDAGSA